jgi:CBS domain containing-hemolysin-like protein
MTIFIVSCTVAIVVSFLCSVAEAVLLSLSQVRLETLKKQGKRYAAGWLDLKRNVDRPIAAILILNTIAHTGGATVAGSAFDEIWGDRYIWIFSVIFTFVVLFGTEIAPKVMGVSYSQRLAPLMIGPLQWAIVVLKPVIVITDLFSKLFRKQGSHGGSEVEAADIVTLAQLAKSRSLIDHSQEQIIINAARLTELNVGKVMLPRADIVYFRLDRSTEENLRIARQALHTRYPVSETPDVDGICAYANFKEIFALEPEHRAAELHPYLRRTLFVRASDKLSDVLRLFIARKSHLAIVKDEQGQVAGMLTLEDVLDEIVGEIEDDLDAGAIDLVAAGPGRWKVGGAVTLGALAETTKVKLEAPPETSLRDFLAAKLGRLSQSGGTLQSGSLRFTVLHVRRNKAHMVLVEVL